MWYAVHLALDVMWWSPGGCRGQERGGGEGGGGGGICRCAGGEQVDR